MVSMREHFRARPLSTALAFLFFLLAACLAPPDRALASGSLLVEDVTLSVPLGPSGQTVALEAVIVRPADRARHPLAVLNHGSPKDPAQRPRMTAVSMLPQAREFARRGFATVAFLRRGFGTSEGGFVEGVGTGSDYAASGLVAAKDIRAVIELMKTKPYVDPSRVIAVGQSAGGLAVTALASEAPPGLVAAINFAGGKGWNKDNRFVNPENVVAAFAQYGGTARVPMLFVYAENDTFFDPTWAGRFFEAFTGAGGKARFVAAPPFGKDGHFLFSRTGIPQWTPTVDAFLAERGLKLLDRPLPLEPQVTGVPAFLKGNCRARFEAFLNAAPHRAFVSSPDGACGWAAGSRTLEEALEKALEYCEEHAGEECESIMLDDKLYEPGN